MSDSPDHRPHLQDFLHHLKELEMAAESKAIKWNAEAAIAAEQRLDRVIAMLRQIVSELTGH